NLWDSGVHTAPFDFSVTFTVEGSFPYFCNVHGSMMQGTIIVVAGAPTPTDTPTETPTETATDTPTGTPTAIATPTNTSVVLHGSVTPQGRPPPPDPRWSVPLRVSLTPQGGGAAMTCTPTTDQSGNFSCAGLAPGSYVGCVKNSQTLQNCRNVTLIAGDNS